MTGQESSAGASFFKKHDLLISIKQQNLDSNYKLVPRVSLLSSPRTERRKTPGASTANANVCCSYSQNRDNELQ